MEKLVRMRRDMNGMGALALIALLLAACARQGGPAPLVSGEQTPPAMQVTVQSGQTLSGIAHAYHVPMSVLAEANHLSPPYRILVGQALIVPGGGEPPPYAPAVAMAEPMSPPPPVSSEPMSAPPPPVAMAEPMSPPSAGPPMALTPPAASVALSPTAVKPPGAIAPPPTSEPLSPPAEHTPRPPAPAAKEASAAPGPAAAAEAPVAHGGGIFLWPVGGHVVEGYGVGPDGTHNDGINIAAPRGAAVEATDGGVVAYAGNELRGYGNLVLIKHPNGWISAYAHCDLILVKTGQKVARGQVIARVGSTGNVSEPQLHFELRRGKKPVDPREYLPATSTASSERSVD